MAIRKVVRKAEPSGKGLPPIRAGMGELETPEAWRDDDYLRATGLASILSSDGKADPAATPALAPEQLRDALRTMLRIRGYEARAAATGEEGQAGEDGEVGGALRIPGVRGLEAAIVGAAMALEPDDIIVPGRREVPVALHRGFSLAALAARGRDGADGGIGLPRALNVLPGSAFTATHLPQATGIAWAMKMQRKPPAASRVTLAYLEAVAASAEDFHAGLNFAGVYKVPAVFLCARDLGAEVAAAVPETVSETVAVKALAYGMPGVRVAGADLLAVYAATRAAVERARRGEGPTLIEAVVLPGETGGPADALNRLVTWLAAQGIVDASAFAVLAAEVDAELAASFPAQEERQEERQVP